MGRYPNWYQQREHFTASTRVKALAHWCDVTRLLIWYASRLLPGALPLSYKLGHNNPPRRESNPRQPGVTETQLVPTRTLHRVKHGHVRPSRGYARFERGRSPLSYYGLLHARDWFNQRLPQKVEVAYRQTLSHVVSMRIRPYCRLARAPAVRLATTATSTRPECYPSFRDGETTVTSIRPLRSSVGVEPTASV